MEKGVQLFEGDGVLPFQVNEGDSELCELLLKRVEERSAWVLFGSKRMVNLHSDNV